MVGQPKVTRIALNMSLYSLGFLGPCLVGLGGGWINAFVHRTVVGPHILPEP